MIRIDDSSGKAHYVAVGSIAHFQEAATSSQWHGIRSIVRLVDGTIIEAQDSCERILTAINASKEPK